MTAILDVPIEGGETILMPMRVRCATIESNDHLHADTLEIEAEYADVGVDPRFVRDANVAFWLEDVGANETRDITQSAPRFVGIANEVGRKNSDSSVAVSLKAVDFTSLFLACKPFPTGGVPRMSDSLVDAWQRICDHTGVFNVNSGVLVSTVAALRDRLEFRGNVDPTTKLSKAVASRFAKLAGTIPVKQNGDAWHVWQQAVGMCGLISFIDGNKCVVTTHLDLFADDADATPTMTWGSNILEFDETAHGRYNSKGVCMVSFDPLTGTTLEAFWPPPGDERIQQRRRVAKKSAKTVVSEVKSEDYDFQSYFGITDPDLLLEIAKMTWEQRARQEIAGSLVTAEMRTDRARGGQFDLLNLRSGESLVVMLDPSIESGAFSQLSEADRIRYLFDRGYSIAAARLLATTAKQRMKYGFHFKVKKSRVALQMSGDSGSFRAHIEFWNRIELG